MKVLSTPLGKSCHATNRTRLNHKIKTHLCVFASRESFYFFYLVVCLGIIGNVAAQSGWRDDLDISSRPFWVNVLFFQDGKTEKTLTEVIIEIPYRSFAFEKTGEGYETNAEVGVVFDDANGYQIDGNAIAEKIRTQDFTATQSHGLTHIFYFAFRLEPESYVLRIIIGDEQMRQRFSYVCKIKAPSFRKSEPQVSSLLLARHLAMSGDNAILQKNGRNLLPNVQHLFAAEQPSGFVYFETYNLVPISAVDSFQVYCSISQQGREVRSASWKSSKPQARAAVSLPLPLSDLAPGEYMLTIRVVDLNGRREASAVAIFYIARPSKPSLG